MANNINNLKNILNEIANPTRRKYVSVSFLRNRGLEVISDKLITSTDFRRNAEQFNYKLNAFDWESDGFATEVEILNDGMSSLARRIAECRFSRKFGKESGEGELCANIKNSLESILRMGFKPHTSDDKLNEVIQKLTDASVLSDAEKAERLLKEYSGKEFDLYGMFYYKNFDEIRMLLKFPIIPNRSSDYQFTQIITYHSAWYPCAVGQALV